MTTFLPFTRPSIDAESIAAVAEVFRSGQLASGPKVQAFEGALAAYLGGGRHVRVMTSATAGLEMALEVAGIGPGDEVIVPAMSFAASANVVARVRAKPVFVDIDLFTRNIDLDQVPAAITARTRAIMPVHFAGLPVDMEKLYGLAAEHGLRVVEDAAHAIGSRYADRPIGSFGDLVVFSFHPNKNMTSIEGGAISTGDAAAASSFEQYRFHGIKRNAAGEVDVMFPGAKSNLTDIAAQVGIDQLRRLEGFNARRRVLVSALFRGIRRLFGRRAAGARRLGTQLAYVPGAHRFSRARYDAAAIPKYHGRPRHRHRRALPQHSRPQILSGAGIPRGRHAGGGTGGTRDGHVAAVPGDGRRRCGAGVHGTTRRLEMTAACGKQSKTASFFACKTSPAHDLESDMDTLAATLRSAGASADSMRR